MFWVAVAGIAVAVLWQLNKANGTRFVRAVRYIILVDTGTPPVDANIEAQKLLSKGSDPEADVEAIRFAQNMAKLKTNGKQHPWIQAAREKGFLG